MIQRHASHFGSDNAQYVLTINEYSSPKMSSSTRLCNVHVVFVDPMWPRAPSNAAQHRLELLVEAPARPPVATAPALPPPCTWPGFLTDLHDFCLRLARISDQNYRLKSWEEARTTPAYNLPHLQLSCLRILLAQIVMPNRVYKSYSCSNQKKGKSRPNSARSGGNNFASQCNHQQVVVA